ncbi:hypothetical protein GA0115240_135230 [Streptomyces sp. DvalAA-14]|nr:hypothetical protein GA0115240_135230 [Streptomyces sp. DvalAA-14]
MATSAKPGTRESARSSQVATTSRVCPTRSRTASRTRVLARAASTEVTSRTITATPKGVPCGSCNRNADSESTHTRPGSAFEWAASGRSGAGAPLSSTSRSIASTRDGLKRSYTSVMRRPSNRCAGSAHRIWAAEFIWMILSPLSRICRPAGDLAKVDSRSAVPSAGESSSVPARCTAQRTEESGRTTGCTRSPVATAWPLRWRRAGVPRPGSGSASVTRAAAGRPTTSSAVRPSNSSAGRLHSTTTPVLSTTIRGSSDGT